MSKKVAKTKKSITGLASEEKITSAKYKEMTGVTAQQDFMLKLREISNLLWHPSNATPEERDHKIARALELYEGLNPTDSLEGMLALQMIATHDAGLECLRRAAIPEQHVDIKDMYLKHAQKLLDLHLKQVATLDKRRGKGQQKVTVEYVNVEPGAQAIVGNLETAFRKRGFDETPKTIETSDEQTVDEILDASFEQKPLKEGRKK